MSVGPFYYFAEFQHSSLSQKISGSLPVFCPERNYSVGQMGQAGREERNERSQGARPGTVKDKDVNRRRPVSSDGAVDCRSIRRTRSLIIRPTAEIAVTLSWGLLRHLRGLAAELDVPLRWLVSGLACDTVERLASGRLGAGVDAQADRPVP